MSQSGDQGSEPGLGREPVGGWPEFVAPGQSNPQQSAPQPPDNQPPNYPPPNSPAWPGQDSQAWQGQDSQAWQQQSYQPWQQQGSQSWQQTGQSWQQTAQPWQQTGQPWQQTGPAPTGGRKNHTTAIALIVVGVVVALLVATVVIVVNNLSSQQTPPPAPAPAPSRPASSRTASPSPGTGPSTQSPTDALGKALESTGLACIQANAQPVINICDNLPAASLTEIRWFVRGRDTIAFQLYAKDQSAGDAAQLAKRLQLLQLAGINSTDGAKIVKTLARSKKTVDVLDAHAGWGSVDVQYFKSGHLVEIFGDKAGVDPARFHGKGFQADIPTVAAQVRKAGYSCTAESGSLSCTHGDVYLSMYGIGKQMTDIYVSERTPAADRLLTDLLPSLLGRDAGAVQPLVTAGMDQPFYLGAAAGYVVLGNTNTISVEAISW